MKIHSKGHEATIEAGRRLGSTLRAGDTVCLYGDLGAGKTVFAKGVAMALGIPEREVASASYTIVAEYDTTPPFYHIDLYRLKGGDDLDAIGLYEYLGAEGIALVEWAERLPDEETRDAISVNIKFVSEDVREIIIEGND